MELSGFTKREPIQGDRWPAKDAAETPLVVLPREHRTGIKTKYNNRPDQPGYKPDGGEGVVCDVANLNTHSVFIDVLWMNGAIVDNLAGYIGQVVAVKLVWTASVNGGNSYLTVEPLDGPELAKAQQWVAANSTRFDVERAQRQANAASFTQQAPQQQAPAPQQVPQQQPAAPAQPATPAPTGTGAVDVNNPEVQALLRRLAEGTPTQ